MAARTFRTHTATRRAALALLIALPCLGLRIAAERQTVPTEQAATSRAGLADLPLAFEPNLGQMDDSVDFLVHHGQAVTAFSSTGTTTSVGGKQIAMTLTGASAQDFAGTDELASNTNYFIGNDQSQWQRNIPNYGKLVANNVYPGIDLAYYGTNSQLEHDFIVAPGVDYRQIAFGFTGQDDLALDDDGNLVLKAGGDTLTLNAPVTYQIDTNSKHTIPSNFELHDGVVTVAVADTYDPAKPLVIDPTLVYSTYLGGSGEDRSHGVVVDSSGNLYIHGNTTSTDFPTAGSPYQGSKSGGQDAFVAKLNAAGTALIYATYLGGSENEESRKFAVDASGNVYITGATNSSDFPTESAFQGAKPNPGSIGTGFVTKLDPSGSSLVYSTYLGGSNYDLPDGIAVDGAGNAYVTGDSQSTDFPTASPIQGSLNSFGDMFVTKLNPSGTALVYSTYLGGSVYEHGYDIDVDASGSAYITGYTQSTDFPTASPIQGSSAGDADVVIAKLNPSGTALVYSTYLGGSGNDDGIRIKVANTGEAYVSGWTASADFPTEAAFQDTYGGGTRDAFVAKVNASGTALVYSTYLGGSALDSGVDVAIGASGNAYVVGFTESSDFPTAGSPYQASNAGGGDAFITELDPAGSALIYSTFLGGSGNDLATDVSLDGSGNAHIVGHTASSNFPTLLPFQGTYGGSTDSFLVKLSELPYDPDQQSLTVDGVADPILAFALGSTLCDLGHFSPNGTVACTHTMSAASNAGGGYVVSHTATGTLTNGGSTIDAMASQTGSTVGSEQFGMNLVANTAAGSHTTSNFGAGPSGGSGAVLSGYQTANQFKFTVAGADLAHTTGASEPTTYTVSYIANITAVTEAGAYSTPITYTIVVNY